MITVQCPHCSKSFTFNPAAAVKNPVEHYSESGKDQKLVEYRVACTHCGKRSNHLRREK